ncbi:MAG: 3-dehydroquinate synthase [Roseburia sp.]|nr:3-dehydroquinate synthase [Roseburia sp.]
MAKTLPVTLNGFWIYDIMLEHDFHSFAAQWEKLYGNTTTRKVCIVSDTNVAPLYLEELKQTLKDCNVTVFSHVFEAGEQSKNLDTVQKLYEDLILNHFDRHDVLIALGGGVVGDLTGFSAATYLRGIDFIQVPTSLLSQVDSSIGGKTGVDFKQYKNMVGAFYMPKLVYMNLSMLNTLPKKQLISGMGEILKHGLIKDESYFSWLKDHKSEIKDLSDDVIEKMVEKSCEIKRAVVERDAKEQGERALLNFGHTIGHAIEKLSDFSLYHGECVGVGCIAASYLSMKCGYINECDFQSIEQAFRDFGFVTRVHGYDAKEILATTKSDKKMVGSKINFVLLQKIGNAFLTKELTDEQILSAIEYVIE